jgi:hypothetical protein
LYLSRSISLSINQGSKQTTFHKCEEEPVFNYHFERTQWGVVYFFVIKRSLFGYQKHIEDYAYSITLLQLYLYIPTVFGS